MGYRQKHVCRDVGKTHNRQQTEHVRDGRNRNRQYGIYYAIGLVRLPDQNGDFCRYALSLMSLDTNDSPVYYNVPLSDTDYWRRVLKVYYGVDTIDGLVNGKQATPGVFMRCRRCRRDKTNQHVLPVLPDRAIRLVNLVLKSLFSATKANREGRLQGSVSGMASSTTTPKGIVVVSGYKSDERAIALALAHNLLSVSTIKINDGVSILDLEAVVASRLADYDTVVVCCNGFDVNTVVGSCLWLGCRVLVVCCGANGPVIQHRCKNLFCYTFSGHDVDPSDVIGLAIVHGVGSLRTEQKLIRVYIGMPMYKANYRQHYYTYFGRSSVLYKHNMVPVWPSLDVCDDIVSGDLEAIRSSDALLCVMYKPSIGAAMEMVYAYQLYKCVVVMAPEDIAEHPWIVAHADHVVYTSSKPFDDTKQFTRDLSCAIRLIENTLCISAQSEGEPCLADC